MPDDPKDQAQARTTRCARLSPAATRRSARQYRDKLAELYGKERAAKVEYAEAFEVCEYGRQPDAAELRRLFPFFDK